MRFLFLKKKKLPSERKVDESDHESDLYKEQFGMRFVVQCNEFRLRLQANLADDGLPERLDNVRTSSLCCCC